MTPPHSSNDSTNGTSSAAPNPDATSRQATEALPESPRQIYAVRRAQFARQAEDWTVRSNRVSNWRGLCFALFLACLIGVSLRHDARFGWAALASLLGFFYLVSRHSRVLAAEERALRWLQVNRDAERRTSGAFKELDDGADFKNPLHPYADDLDVFGRASLFQLINTARTQFGRARVAAYLMNRATPGEIQRRQAAAKFLAPLLELRQELEALGILQVEGLTPAPKVAKRQPDLSPLLTWAEGAPVLRHSKSLRIVSIVAPVLTTAWLTWCWWHGTHALFWVLPLIAQAILLLSARQQTSYVFSVVSSHQGAFLRFGPMFSLIESLNSDAELVNELKSSLLSGGSVPPSVMMRRFERIVSWFELRHNGLIYPFVNLVTLWDLHCTFALEAWQADAGKRLRAWFQTLGEFEALASLATFSYDNPDYAWPSVAQEAVKFEAEGLGHPLILGGRVTNDVSIQGRGHALLVTGSNMSGKSTLLRAMGVAAVLAQAGACVCARRLHVGPLAVRTSMRISDSLDQGVSHFYAELRKLKSVLDATQSDVAVLFLLDEVLHGTNSGERQIGARWLLAELLQRGALGAVSTHDSGLCELPPQLMQLVRQVHLRETAVGEELTFDFKLREGPVQSGNALRLMRSLGMEVPIA